jgi:hypothetical protein
MSRNAFNELEGATQEQVIQEQENANVLEGIPETFINELNGMYQKAFGRNANASEIAYYAGENEYGTDAISPEEKSRFANAVRLQKSKDRGFDSDVNTFFRRTLDRDATPAELIAYANAYKKLDADGGYSFDRQEQDISRQNLLEERQQKFGLGDQIAALYKGTFGTTPDPTSYGEAEQFFQKLGEYGTDPRRITARDAQKFKEQVVMPKQLAKIPMNYANMSPTNLPTSFLAPNSPLPAVGADGLPVPTGSLPNVAITGGVAPLPTGAPTTAPKMVDVTAPVVNTTPAGYKRGGTVEVNMNRGGDPVLEMLRQQRQRGSLEREEKPFKMTPRESREYIETQPLQEQARLLEELKRREEMELIRYLEGKRSYPEGYLEVRDLDELMGTVSSKKDVEIQDLVNKRNAFDDALREKIIGKTLRQIPSTSNIRFFEGSMGNTNPSFESLDELDAYKPTEDVKRRAREDLDRILGK